MSLSKEVPLSLAARAGVDESRGEVPMMLLDDGLVDGNGETDRETAGRLAEALGGELEEVAAAA